MTGTLDASYRLRVDDGRLLDLEVDRWTAPADAVDHGVLDRARAPVLDIGCGPGRIVAALHRRGLDVLGVDIAPGAARAARRHGAPVMQCSVFDPLPHEGGWCSAVLLDGSVGIGGDPVRLLYRVQELLVPGGSLLVETRPPDECSEAMVVRIETAGRAGAWFPWAHLSATDLATVAVTGGFAVVETWVDGGRHFAELVAQRRTYSRYGRNATSVAGKKHR